MRAAAVMSRIVARTRRWQYWIPGLLFGSIFAGFFVSALGWSNARLHDILYPYILAFAYVFPGPAGWQYTGDDRFHPGFLRGLLQSILWCGLLFVVSLLIPHLLAKVHDWPGLSWLKWQEAIEWPLMVLITWFIARGEEVQASFREAAAQAQEAQWNLLRSQLSPHFLFNALSAFAELGRRDWPATEKGLLSLSSVYRKLLNLSQGAETTLGEERQLISELLSIEALRLGDRLRLTWVWDEGLDGLQAPSLLILPLVENAVKHGLGGRLEGGEVVIRGQREPDGVLLEVANTGAWDPDAGKGAGVGLKNLKARLQLGYKGRASFSLTREGEWTRATLRLPAATG
ncbi:MAG: histidine kinase [Acidobacteria bacterium]|nr:histidine kinase [Acidobacteriota bacterium]